MKFVVILVIIWVFRKVARKTSQGLTRLLERGVGFLDDCTAHNAAVTYEDMATELEELEARLAERGYESVPEMIRSLREKYAEI